MLADSRLPQRFWAEALSTAAYMINRSPTKALDDKTPFEAWYGKKPNVSHLRVFGCSAYTHVPKDQRKKLDSKAKGCIFLGYATSRKGYRLYDQKTSSIVHSRDVVFNELSKVFPRSKVWTMTKPSVQSSISNRFEPWLQSQFRKVSSFISWT